MSSYLSVISAVIRPEINEKISIGLLLMSPDELFLSFSKNKLEVVGQLLPENIFRGVRFSVRSFQKVASESEGKKTLFTNHTTIIENIQNTVFKQSYLHYLNTYKNNIITVSEPNPIDIPANRVVFEKLFKNLIDEFGVHINSKRKRKSFSILKSREQLIERFNYDLTISQADFPNLIVPVKVDMVGKNEKEIFVKSIDLERRTHFISNDVCRFESVKNAIPKSKRFVVSREPLKNEYPKQHIIWKNIRNAKWFDYVDISEVEVLEEYAILHNVQKLKSNQTEIEFDE